MSRVQLEIKEEELKQAKLETLRQALELQDRVDSAVTLARERRGIEVPASIFAAREVEVPEEYKRISNVLDNARIVGAFEVLDLLGITVEIQEEYCKSRG